MGINPTQSNFKSFTFGGVNSRAYGVYITGEGVFNAPERNVEMIEIPGRNGAYALDKGNFNNIEVTYPASIATDNATDFAQAVSDLRNLLCSKVGYVRLEDDYNTGEYRMAIYKSGLEVSHDMLIAGEFDIVFECKPQRFLKSGETAISVTSGDTITNPTLFDAKPLIEIYGYGDIGINSDTLSVDNVTIGWVDVAPPKTLSTTVGTGVSSFFDITFATAGDDIAIGSEHTYVTLEWSTNLTQNVKSVSASVVGTGVTAEVVAKRLTTNKVATTINLNTDGALLFTYGTSATVSAVATVVITLADNTTRTGTVTGTLQYLGNHILISVSDTNPTDFYDKDKQFGIDTIRLNSTLSALNPAYIDLDIGECYKISGDSIASINNAVAMPSELPVLTSGSNTITYDNTFTSVKVTPRWWKV